MSKRFTLDNNAKKARLCLYFFLFAFIVSCKQPEKKIKLKELVADPKSLNEHVQDNIKNSLLIALDKDGKVQENLRLDYYKIAAAYYEKNDYQPLWSNSGSLLPQVHSLMNYLDTSMLDGLYMEDYHYQKLNTIKRELETDSVKRTDAVLWTNADILLTDAFMHIVHDLAQGRLQHDSSSWKNDTSKYNKYFFASLDKFKNKDTLNGIFQSLQPRLPGYLELKAAIKDFVDSMDTKSYTYINYPYKAGDENDSLNFIKKLQLRLKESGVPDNAVKAIPDSAELATSIKNYQKLKKILPDGKISKSLIAMLNVTDVVKYNRIAVTLDRYKQMPDTLPERYIWVNLPSYYMQVHDSDSVVFTSKIICGKTTTPTPTLMSAISDIVIYPTWTVPESIIKKEMLPALKKNSGYLARKGLHLYNSKGEVVDPTTVNWAKYSKGIPYKIQQGSGDDNALGVIKFNFSNPFAVYLHDTNQRYMFKNSMRALSHGCVRVQDWEKLAFYIIRNDSTRVLPDTLKYNTDSITNWIANKEKHRLNVKFQIPLFIRYFSCEGINGAIKFYEDIYADDKALIDKYFAGK